MCSSTSPSIIAGTSCSRTPAGVDVGSLREIDGQGVVAPVVEARALPVGDDREPVGLRRLVLEDLGRIGLGAALLGVADAVGLVVDLQARVPAVGVLHGGHDVAGDQVDAEEVVAARVPVGGVLLGTAALVVVVGRALGAAAEE